MILKDCYIKKTYLLLIGLLLFSFQTVNAQTAKNIAKVSDTVLESYSGRFAVSPNFILTFNRDTDHLSLVIPGQPPIALYPESQTKFFIKEQPDITVEFSLGANGVFDKAMLTQGKVLTANRLGQEGIYNPIKEYTINQLMEDFNFFRSTLEKVHPRLYEFTSKAKFDSYFDSLYKAINRPMNEIEFRYFLLPSVAMVHCGHTSLMQSIGYTQHRPSLMPPFNLYYEGQKAYVRYSASELLKPGTEVLAVNSKTVKIKLNNSLERVSGDGIHLNVQYALINKPMSWFSYEISEWFNVRDYNILVANSNNTRSELHLKAIDMPEFIKRMPPPQLAKNKLDLLDDNKSAILTYPRIDFPNDSIRNNFLTTTFLRLKEKNISNLIIDLRGNGGGKPENAVYLLRFLMNKDFIYSNTKTIPEYIELSKVTKVDDNRFKGKMYYLIDGECFSTTGHLLSIVQYYKLGALIGESSSGTYSSNTVGFPYPLPNSQLVLNCPDGIYETAVNGYERAQGISPDYEVKNTFKDTLEGKDTVLEFTLKKIAEYK